MTHDDEYRAGQEQHRGPSRRRFLKGAVGAGVGVASAGIYDMVDTIAKPPERTAFAATQPWPPEQYIVQNTQVAKVNAAGINSSAGTIAVDVPPLHDHVITATLNVPANVVALQEAQHHLESVLLGLEQTFTPTPAGLGIAVAWGLPYFHHYIPRLGKTSSFFPSGDELSCLSAG